MEDLVPRQNIAPRLTDELCAMIADKNWKVRKEGLDKLREIVSSAKFITNDLAGLPAALGPRTTDTNKNLAIQALELVSELVVAMGPQSRVTVPQLLPPVLLALADSKPNVRQAAVGVVKTFLQETSLRDMLVNEIFATAVTKGNPFVKQEVFQWLAETLPEAPTKGINKEELLCCLPVLYAGVEDRAAEVRKATQEAIQGFMRHLGYESMRKATEKLSAVSKNTVMPLLDKARAALPPPPARAPPPQSAGGPRAVNRPVREESTESSSTGGDSRAGSAAPRSVPAAKPGGSGRPGGPAGRPGAKGSVSSSKAGGVKKAAPGEEVDTAPLYSANKLKNTRFRDETKLKVLKWNFTSPRAEFVEQLKDQMAAASFNKSLVTMMFHADFKQHLKALDQLVAFTEDGGVEALVGNLDLLLKWMTLRFFETNPSVNIKGLEYLTLVFQVVSEAEERYSLHEIEAVSFIPFLINKIGDPKDQIRQSCRTILRLVVSLYPASKLFTFVLNGLGTKNAKQRAECLEEIGNLIRSNGVGVCGPQPAVALKEVAKQIADRDNSVRNAALNAVTEAYFQEGEKLYRMVGNLPEKDMAMLEERIKRASKTRTVAAVEVPVAEAPAPVASARALQQQQQNRANNNSSSSSGGGLPRPGGLRPPSAASAGLAREGETDVRLRYQQLARGGSAGPRPTSGAFTLDLEKIEAGFERVSDMGPKLVEHDLDDIINSDPVMMPVTRTGMQKRVLSPDHHSARMVQNHDANQSVNAVIAQIFSTDSQTSLTALAQLDCLLKSGQDKVEVLGPCVDHLFSMCGMQYRYVLQTRMKQNTGQEEENMRLLQYLTMVLMSTYGHRDIVKKASMQVLHDLVHVIVLILLEPAVAELHEGGALVRALNVLTVKIVDRSDHDSIAVALIKLLHECVGSSSLSDKYCVLVMKCLWKLIRGLPAWLEGMDVGGLLLVLHEFLKTFPSAYWKKQEDDTPMRTIKTVIHTLVKVMGEPLLSHATHIPDSQDSELVPYIRKLVNSGIGQGAESIRPPSSSTAASQLQQGRRKSGTRFTKSDHEALADIFKKIGQKELTKVGLQDLYNFKQENPHADLEPFLAKSSEYFRDYIERGLRTIEQEVKSGGCNSAAAPPPGGRSSVLSDSNNGSSASGQPAHLFYLERLKRLRAAGGLDSGQENMENYSASQQLNTGSGFNSRYNPATSRYNQPATDNSQEENQNSDSAPGGGSSNSASSVEEIRKRLAKIKQAAF